MYWSRGYGKATQKWKSKSIFLWNGQLAGKMWQTKVNIYVTLCNWKITLGFFTRFTHTHKKVRSLIKYFHKLLLYSHYAWFFFTLINHRIEDVYVILSMYVLMIYKIEDVNIGILKQITNKNERLVYGWRNILENITCGRIRPQVINLIFQHKWWP